MKKWLKELDDDGWLAPIAVFVVWGLLLGYCMLIRGIAASQVAM